jgi:hypothetical protein
MLTVLASSVTLTGPQIGEAVHLVCKLFDKAELKQLVKVKLEFDLFVEAATENDRLENIAYDLMVYLNRHGLVHEFLEAVATERPKDEGLRQFVLRAEGTAPTVSPKEQIGAFESAIQTVAKQARADSKFRELVGMGKVRFELVRDELDRLARYKALHDCLHNLQLMLSAITRAGRAFPADRTAGRDLLTYVDQLAREATRARKSTSGLLTEPDELVWVEDFDRALVAIPTAVKSNPPASVADAVDALGRLLPEAARINGEMIGAARRLAPGLDQLAKVLDDLPECPATTPGAPRGEVVGRLEAGAHALDGLTPRLAGLANTHDTWQKIETALAAAEAIPDGPPSRRVPRWNLTKKLLERVCPTGSTGDPTADPVTLTQQWEQTTEAIAAENCYLTLRTAELHEFKKVDDQLLGLADQLTKTVQPLNTLLEVI